MLTPHGTILIEGSPLARLAAFFGHRSGWRCTPILPSAGPFALSLERGSPVPAQTAHVRSIVVCGFLVDCDLSIPNTLRVPGHGTPNAVHRALQRDDTPHSRMDPATVSGSHSLRSLLPLSDPPPRFDLLGSPKFAGELTWASLP
jgi:hypothetical protein